jgi:hypothetical protein
MSEPKHLVTLSDHNYLVYGLALYDSIDEQTEDYVLHYLCTSQEAYDKLVLLDLPNIKPYNIKDLDSDEDFLRLKTNQQSNTTSGYDGNNHFHWALASFFSYYLMDNYDLPHVVYIDSDIMFYNPVDRVLDAMQDKSIGIITHKHMALEKSNKNVGYYNVGVIVFKNTEVGKSCLKFCLDLQRSEEHKYAEDFGTCGDQKYLELFDELFDEKEIKVLCHDVGNLAPWNLHMCKLLGNNEFMWYDNDGFVLEPQSSKIQSLVFMHFSHFNPNFDNKSFALDRGGEWGPIAKYENVIGLYEEYYISCAATKRKYKV